MTRGAALLAILLALTATGTSHASRCDNGTGDYNGEEPSCPLGEEFIGWSYDTDTSTGGHQASFAQANPESLCEALWNTQNQDFFKHWSVIYTGGTPIECRVHTKDFSNGNCGGSAQGRSVVPQCAPAQCEAGVPVFIDWEYSTDSAPHINNGNAPGTSTFEGCEIVRDFIDDVKSCQVYPNGPNPDIIYCTYQYSFTGEVGDGELVDERINEARDLPPAEPPDTETEGEETIDDPAPVTQTEPNGDTVTTDEHIYSDTGGASTTWDSFQNEDGSFSLVEWTQSADGSETVETTTTTRERPDGTETETVETVTTTITAVNNNGNITPAGDGTSTANEPTTTTTTTTTITNNYPDGSSDTTTTESTDNCTGEGCTPGDGSGGDGDGDGRDDKDQQGEEEETGESLSGGNACGTPPTCEGSPINCYIAQQAFETQCALQQPDDAALDTAINEGLDEDGDGEIIPNIDTGLNISDWFTENAAIGGGCLPDINMNIPLTGSAVTIPLSHACPLVAIIRLILLASTALFCLRLIFET